MKKLILILFCIVNLTMIFADSHINQEEFDTSWEAGDYFSAFENEETTALAWEKIETDPSVLKDNWGLLEFVSSPENFNKFSDTIQENPDLLNDPTVVEYYENAIAKNPDMANDNPKAFGTYLESKGINGFENSQYNVESFSEGEIKIFDNNGNVIKGNIDMLLGSQLLPGEGIELSNGEIILQGEIVSKQGDTLELVSISNNPAISKINDKTFVGNHYQVGFLNLEGKHVIKPLNQNPIHFEDYSKTLTKGFILIDEKDLTLGENTELKSYTITDNSDPLNKREKYRTYKTNNRVTITSNSCKNHANCIFEKEGFLGIETKNNIDLQLVLHTNEKTKIEVKPIENENTKIKIVSNYEGQTVQFVTTKKGVSQIGFLQKNNNLEFVGHTINNEIVTQHSISNIISPKSKICQSLDLCFTGHKKAFIAYGTNEWENPQKAKQKLREYVNTLRSKGYEPVIVPPLPQNNPSKANLKGVQDAHDAIMEIVQEMDLLHVKLSPSDSASDKYHLSSSAIARIKKEFPEAEIAFGDSNAVRIGGDTTYAEANGRSGGSDNINTDLLIENVPDRSNELERTGIGLATLNSKELSLAESNLLLGNYYVGDLINTNYLVSKQLSDVISQSKYKKDFEKILAADNIESNFKDGSIVNGLSKLGVDTSLEFRKELYKLLIPDGTDKPGSASFNIALINALEEESLTSTQTYIATTGTTTSSAPIETSNWRTENICNIGELCVLKNNLKGAQYTRVNVNLYCHADKTCYNRAGERVNKNGEYIRGSVTNPEICPNPNIACENSVYKNTPGVWATNNVLIASNTITNEESQQNGEEIIEPKWKPYGCEITNDYTCKIGNFNYKLLSDGTFEARDKEKFNHKGERINEEGKFVDKAGNLCADNNPCAYSSQVAHFNKHPYFPSDDVELYAAGFESLYFDGSTSINTNHPIIQKIRSLHSDVFLNEVEAMAKRLYTTPEVLFSVMELETAGKFKTGRYKGVGAVGLIQFTESAIDNINNREGLTGKNKLTKSKLVQMSGIEQLKYAELHMSYSLTKSKLRNKENFLIEDVYLSIFAPAHVGKTSDSVYVGELALNNPAFIDNRYAIPTNSLTKIKQYLYGRFNPKRFTKPEILLASTQQSHPSG